MKAKVIFGTVLTVVALAAIAMGLLYVFQAKLIYFPRDYDTYGSFIDKAEEIRYQSEGNEMTAYLYPNRGGSAEVPEKVWWMFGGNGSLALDWVSLLEGSEVLPASTLYVMVDYPGYGRSSGSPDPQKIRMAVSDLFASLQEEWQLDSQQLASRSSVVGHSLGASIALNTAERFNIENAVAISPFTTMQDMAKRQMGPFSFLLNHHYDNRQAVTQLSNRKKPASIIIFHGKRDSLIPISMGRELAELSDKGNIFFQEVPDYGHNDILYGIRNDLLHLLTSD